MESRLKELCVQLFDVGALKFGDFKIKVGSNSPVYFDLRIMISYPKIMGSLSKLLWEFAKSEGVKCDVLCGVPYTALPIATLIAVNEDLPMLIRRKEAKDYGTKKLIEGVFNKNDRCVIIEDVVTTGSSIVETVNDLKKEGLVVKETVVVLSREQGGCNNLAKQGITMRSLLTLTQVLKHLQSAGKIDDATVEKTQTYIRQNQLDTRGEIKKTVEVSRMEMTFGDRAGLSACAVASRLLQLMESKQSSLCVAADVTTSADLLSVASEVGPHCAVLKTHADLVTDWTQETAKQLRQLANKYNFLIMEDRKFADIGHTVGLQYAVVAPWADLVTVHALAGDALLTAIAEETKHITQPRGVFIVAELSCAGNLITNQYTKSAVKQATSHPELVAGLVCQSSDVVISPGLIQLTPGVSATTSGDSLGQQYNSPHAVVYERGADLAVVGRAIVTAGDRATAAIQYRKLLWQAYLERTKH